MEPFSVLASHAEHPPVSSQNEKTTLLGKTKQDYASILRWMSFANSEVLDHASQWFQPLIGRLPYNKKQVDDALAKLTKSLTVLEKHLLINTFFVSERMTVADLFVAGMVSRVYQYYMDDKNRKAYPCLTRWFETVTKQPVWEEANGKPEIATEALKNVQPKQEAAAKKEKAPAKPAAKAADEEEEDKPAPKPKHPLEALPKPTLVLDDWKRKYSNEETREVALPWFWEHFKSDEYSVWQVNYKYNEELTLTFMTSNLIGT
jgi:elongation factor 1-gamma